MIFREQNEKIGIPEQSQDCIVKKEKSDSMVPEMHEEPVQQEVLNVEKVEKKELKRTASSYSDD